MDALSAAVLPSTAHHRHSSAVLSPSHPFKSATLRLVSLGDLRVAGKLASSRLSRLQAVSHGGAQFGGEDVISSNGRAFVFGRDAVQSDANISEKDVRIANEGPLMNSLSANGASSSGSRAGLFRTPVSGGVQSATSAHGLPHPALAVRNLLEQARFAHLCTVMSHMHHRQTGYPFGTLVDFAPDSMGHPIFSFSPLGIHTRNILADPRCTLIVQTPGWSGLSNARVTLFGDVYPLPEDQQEQAHMLYVAKHQQCSSQQWGNFHYYKMENISDIYFIGGFGTVAWVDVKLYESLSPDKITVNGGEQYLEELNNIFSKPLRELLSMETEVDDAALISIDGKGTDIRVRQGAQFKSKRLSFDVENAVETLEEAKAALYKVINKNLKSKPSK